MKVFFLLMLLLHLAKNVPALLGLQFKGLTASFYGHKIIVDKQGGK